MNIRDSEALKAIISQAVLDALRTQPFPLYTAPQVASIFCVSTNTVLTWRKKGLIKGHCHILSGRSWRWLFAHSDLLAFFAENFPSDQDIAVHLGQLSEFNPKTSKIIQFRKLLAMRRLFSRTHSRRKPAGDVR